MLFFESQHAQLHASSWRSFGRREEARNGGRRQDRPWTAAFCTQPCGRTRGSRSFRAPSPLRSARGGREIFQHPIKKLSASHEASPARSCPSSSSASAARLPRTPRKDERLDVAFGCRLDVVWLHCGVTSTKKTYFLHERIPNNGKREQEAHSQVIDARRGTKKQCSWRTRGMIVRLPCHGSCLALAHDFARGGGRVCEVSVTIQPNIFLLASLN